MMVLFVAALIVGAILLFRRLPAAGAGPALPGAAGPAAPLDLLRQRFARGEISREQYQQMRQDLQR